MDRNHNCGFCTPRTVKTLESGHPESFLHRAGRTFDCPETAHPARGRRATKIQPRLSGVANGQLAVTVPASDVKPWLALVPAFAAYGHALPLSRKGHERGKRPTSDLGWSGVWLWDTRKGVRIGCLAEHRAIKGFGFWPNGSTMTVAYTSGSQFLSTWDFREGREIKSVGLDESIRGIILSSDGLYLATADNFHTVSLWEPVTLTKGLILRGHTDIVQSVVFGPYSTFVASGSSDGTVRFWPTGLFGTTRRMTERGMERMPREVSCDRQLDEPQLGILVKYKGTVNPIALSLSGKLLAIGGVDGIMRFWDIVSWRQVDALREADRFWRIQFSPNGSLLAAVSEDGVGYAVTVWRHG